MTRLAKKEYWRHFEPTPEWVVLLIPNEGMFRTAVEHDPTLLESAIRQNVLLASPITLIAVLKAIAYGWQQENRARSVQQIIEHSHTLHRQFKAFITQWNNLYRQLGGTVDTFNQLTTTFQTTLLPVIQHICDLDETIKVDEYKVGPGYVQKTTIAYKYAHMWLMKPSKKCPKAIFSYLSRRDDMRFCFDSHSLDWPVKGL